ATSFDAASTIQVDGTDVLTWNSVISGAGGLAKTGTGTLKLGADNSAYAGDVSLSGGTLALTNKNGIGIGNDVATAAGTIFDLTGVEAGNPGTGAGIVQIGALTGAGQVNLGDSFLVSTVGAGQSAAFSGTLVSDGWAYDSVYGRFYKAGAGDLVINGSTMERGEATIIEGSMTQSAGDSAWSNINVGGDGGSGQLNVSGGTLTLNVGLRVGDFGGTGTVNQTGGTVQLEQSCDDDDSCASLNIGNQGGTGVYNISGGSLLLGGGSHSIGRNAGSRPASSGTLNISGTGLVELSPDISDGFLVIGDRDPGTQPNSTGVINQTGGTLRIAGSRFYLGGYGAGTYNLNGGTLEIGGSSLLGLYGGGGNTTGTYDFNLGGGTIKVIGSSLTTSVDAELTGSSVSSIDTNGFDATWDGEFSGTGSLRKSGEGTLFLTGPNSYSGDTYLAGGKVSAAEGALGTGQRIVVEASSTLAFGDADGTTLSQNIGLAAGAVATFEIGAGATGTLAGQLAGQGGVTKTGEGTLVLDRTGVTDEGLFNNYSGATVVEDGVLRIASSGALSTKTAVTVWDGAIFEVSGAGVTQDVESLDGDGSVAIAGEGATLNVTSMSGSATVTVGAGAELAVGALSGAGTINLNDPTASAVVGGSGQDTTFSGTLSGSGSFVKEGSSVLVIDASADTSGFTGPTAVSSGKLVLNGSLENSEVSVGAGGALGGNGKAKTVTLAGGASVGPGNSPGTFTAGEFTFGAGSFYNAEFGFDGSGNPVSDNILITTVAATSGNAVIEEGAILSLDVSEGVRIGHDYEIISIESSGSVVQTDGAQFDLRYDAPLLLASVAYEADAVTVSFSGIAAPWSTRLATRNQGATANAVQSMGPDSPLFDSTVILGAGQLGPAFDLLSGEIGASAKTVLVNDSQFLRSAVLDRLASAENPGAAGGIAVAPLAYGAPATPAAASPFPVKAEPAPVQAPSSAVWAQAFGSWGSTDGNANAAALDRNTGGFFIGADTLFNGWRIGALGGYSQTSFDVDARASSGDSDNYHAGLYAGTNWGAVNFRSGASYSWNNVSTTRYASLPLPETLKADYSAGTAQAFGELGYGMTLGAANVEPFVGLAYVNLGTDAYTETGGLAGLHAPSSSMATTYSTLGLRASTAVDLGTTVATLKGLLGWRHAFGDVESLATYSFATGSAPFTVEGVPIAQDSLLVDVGMNVAVSAFVNLGLAYNGEFGDGATDQAVRGTLDWKF
ncbi:autotransporter domain-containing protein, partial [Starkeya koreensis]